MISVKDLKVKVGEKEILKGISLDFEIGKNYLLLGKNGSGKSSLSSVIAGNPKYEVVDGEIEIKNVGVNLVSTRNTEIQNIGQAQDIAPTYIKNLLSMTPDDRSKAGIFLSFQNVPEIKGINLGEYLRIIYNIHLKNKCPHPNPLLRSNFEDSRASTPVSVIPKGEGTEQEFKEITPFIFKRFIKQYLQEFCIDESFLSRDLNVGFSGGEKRKIEMLQVKLIGPKYIILDEIDSGLDIDAFKIVAELLSKLNSENNTFIIITHYFKIVDYFKIDKVYLLEDGKLKKEGGMEIVDEIKENGF